MRRAAHAAHAALIARVALVASAIAIAGCTSATGRGEPSAADARLESTALHDRPASARAARDTAPPPGLDPAVLAPRVDGRERATSTLTAAVHALGEPAPQPSSMTHPDPSTRAVKHYARGREAALRGEHAVALIEFERARAIAPGSIPVLRAMARSLTELGRFATVVALCEAILEIDPLDSEALFTCAIAATQRLEAERAAQLIARRLAAGLEFDHDPAAAPLAAWMAHMALRRLGWDRASIEAGLEALDFPFRLESESRYLGFLSAMRAKRGDVWRQIGDAHCRLGEVEPGLEAYREAAQLPLGDPRGLQARVLYATVRLDRTRDAARELFASLDGGEADAWDALLARWIAPHLHDPGALAHDVRALARPGTETTGALLVEAALLDGEAAEERARRAFERAPGDGPTIAALVESVRPGGDDELLRLAEELIASHPEHAQAIVARVDRLVHAHPGAGERSGHRARRGPRSLEVAARRLVERWALGEAWSLSTSAIEQFPDDVGLRILRVEIAARLDEPPLVRDAVEPLAKRRDPWPWIVQSNGWLEIEEFDRALAAAHAARAAAERDDVLRVEAHLAMARVHVARAALGFEDAGFLAARAAEAARELEPSNDEAARILVELYRPEGAIANVDALEGLVADLRTTFPASRYATRLSIEESARRSQHDSALEPALRLAVSDPGDEEVLALAITMWEGAGGGASAQAWLAARLAECPDDTKALDQLVHLMVRRNEPGVARDLLLERLARDEEDIAAASLLELVYQMLEEPELERPLAMRRLLAWPEGTRRALQLALVTARTGRPDEAIVQLEWLADRAAGAPVRHLTGAIGVCRSFPLGAGGDETTARLVERTTEAHPKSPHSIYAIGALAAARIGDLSRFDALIRRASASGIGASGPLGRDVEPWQDLAQRLVDADEPELAARALRLRLESAVGLEPEASSALAALAIIADSVSDGGAGRSIELLVRLAARGMTPALPGAGPAATLSEALLAASNLYGAVGNESGSEALLREAVEEDPSNAMALNNLGYLLLDAGRRDEKLDEWIELAYAITGDDDSILDTVGWLRYMSGRIAAGDDGEGAIAYLERAIDPAQPSAEVLDHYGDALWRLDRTDEAVEAWRRAVEILGDTERRQRALRGYLIVQSGEWGLLVADPRDMYHRSHEAVRERASGKIERAERGEAPEVAPIFSELAPDGARRPAAPSAAESTAREATGDGGGDGREADDDGG